jgi:hypothetical protein
MALFVLSTVILTVSGCITCCFSCHSCDSDDQGREHRYQASSSRSSYGTITSQPTYRSRPSPSYTRDSFAPINSTPTVSRFNHISPQGGQCPRVTSPLAVRAFIFPEFPAGRLISALISLPLAIRSPRLPPHIVDVKPYTAMLRCLLWLSCQMSPSRCLIITPLMICGKRPDI